MARRCRSGVWVVPSDPDVSGFSCFIVSPPPGQRGNFAPKDAQVKRTDCLGVPATR
jgi:hypothetical protein